MSLPKLRFARHQKQQMRGTALAPTAGVNRGNTVRIVLGPRSQHEALGLKPSKHSFTASLV